MGFSKKYGNLLTGIVGTLISVLFFGLSIQIGIQEGASIGADFLPKIVCVILLICSILQTKRGVDVMKTYQDTPSEYPSNAKGLLLMIVALIVYAIIMKPLGFLIATILFEFIEICLMTKKENMNYVKIGIITVISVVLIYIVFSQFFGIRLPQGILKGII